MPLAFAPADMIKSLAKICNIMKKDDDKTFETEPIFIGKIIEDELRRQERTVTWLSRKIHCDRRNVYDIFSRTNIDTELLYKLSIILNKDFFAYYSSKLKSFDKEQITASISKVPSA